MYVSQVLIPVLLCVIIRHGNHKERDKLLQILFNLIKRPNEMQRLVNIVYSTCCNLIYTYMYNVIHIYHMVVLQPKYE